MTASVSNPGHTADCGHQYRRDAGRYSTGFAIDPTGATVCYECATARELELIKQGQTIACYLSSDGTRVTNWPGRQLMTVVSRTVARTGWHGSDIVHVKAKDADGRAWWGKGGGNGMVITMRRNR